MRKIILSTVFAAFALCASAQPDGGFGGVQKQNVQLETSQVWRDVNYVGDGQAYHTCDIYLPKQEREAYPVVVHIYGSAWFSNSGKGMADIGTIVKALLDAGYAVVCPNHRSSGDAKWPAQLHDIKAVVRFIRGEAKTYKFDTSFIATSGFSSGGHLASTTATTSGTSRAKVGSVDIDLEGSLGNYTWQSSAVNAAADWSGPIDLVKLGEDKQISPEERSPEDILLNSKLQAEPDKYFSLSANTYIDANTPPIIIFHGQQDNVVPCTQGQRFFEQLQAAGVRTEATFVPDGGHGFGGMYNPENLQKMVNFFDAARGARTRIIEDGGTGPYKAILKEDASLPEHTIIVPQDLSKFSAKRPLPVLVWGNGACANSPFEHINFLNEIASQGYIVLATGIIPMTDEWYKGPMSRSEQQIESIDWIIEQNSCPVSPYYQKIDVNNICVAGMSCGGLQTLYNCADQRIKTLMICNSGLFNEQNANQAVGGMPMPKKDKLSDIHTPIIYILGGEKDIAYGNGMDDFHRIAHVPAVATNFPVGHGGTYREPHGGEFTVVALAWLNWQLKGDRQAARMFLGKNCNLAKRKDWTIEKNAAFEALK